MEDAIRMVEEVGVNVIAGFFHGFDLHLVLSDAASARMVSETDTKQDTSKSLCQNK